MQMQLFLKIGIKNLYKPLLKRLLKPALETALLNLKKLAQL